MAFLFNKLKALDAYPKVRDEEFFTRTMAGGIITITSSIVMALLFFSELASYASTSTQHELVVDSSRGETIRINFDVVFPKMPCSWLSLDAMDISGDLHLDVDHDIYKQRLDAAGHPLKEAAKHDVSSTKVMPEIAQGNLTCGPCYGAEEVQGQCCNTCDEVRAAYRRRGWALTNTDHVEQCKHDSYMETVKEQTGEGCRMWGHLEVNKVAGNFHFAPGRSYQQGSMHVHDIAPFGDARMDFSHRINSLSFGSPYPGMKNPLDGVKAGATGSGGPGWGAALSRTSQSPDQGLGMYQYFLKVVPTSYTPLGVNKTTISSNQFSVTENFREAQGGQHSLPGVFFFYDLSPIKVVIVEHRSSFTSFLTSVCAIVGGVFTVAGLLDSIYYTGERLIKKKMQLGKLS